VQADGTERAPVSLRRVPVALMRGGPVRGLFVHAHDLPSSPRARDALLRRALGGPDPQGRFADGLGAALAHGGRVVVVSRSQRPGCDIEFLVGAPSPDAAAIDWSGGCGPIVAAVGPFAIQERLFPVSGDGAARLRLRHAGTGERIDAFVPVRGGEVLEEGAFADDGVPHAAAEIRLEHLAPAATPFPTLRLREPLAVDGLGEVEATLLDVGGPSVFVKAHALGLTGRERAAELSRARPALERLQALRRAAAARLGLGDPAWLRDAGPRVAWVAGPASYRASAGGEVAADAIDLLLRELPGPGGDPGDGTLALAAAVAAAVPGTVVADVARTLPGVATRIGAADGAASVCADVASRDAGPRSAWRVERCAVSRSARRLLVGTLYVPEPASLSGRAESARAAPPAARSPHRD
jgi:2-methylaconitate cis-trans-isomerase PrpF